MRIVLVGRMAAAAESLLQAEIGSEHDVRTPGDDAARTQTFDVFDDAEVIVGGPVTKEMVARAPRLKLFHVFRGGTDGLGLEHLPSNVAVANTFHHEKSIADFVLMAMLVLSRRACERDRGLRSGDWRGSAWWAEPPETEALEGKVVLIVGWGHIGREVARRARAFDMKVSVVSRNPGDPPDGVNDVVGYDNLHSQLGHADFVIAACRLASNTEGLFGEGEFNRMKPSGLFVNVARGAVADEHALYNALRDRTIAGAAIDVWYQYPGTRDEKCFPSRLPFHELPNVLLSPHCSSWTRQMLESRVRDVAENIRRLQGKEPLLNLVKEGGT